MTGVTLVKVGNTVVQLVKGDITKQAVDAVVNAANTSLLGGGGVDGAIHRAAGPELVAETSQLGGCRTGDAKISGGYRLPAKHVIHAVGPIYRHRNDDEAPRLLASAYRRSLEVAVENQLSSIAFPAISTGIYGYPLDKAAPIALNTVMDYITEQPGVLQEVRMVLWDDRAFDAFGEALTAIAAERDDVEVDV